MFGICARNSILMIATSSIWSREEGEALGREARPARRDRAAGADLDDGLGDRARARAAGARRPLSGHEIKYPMAVVILGGLVTSTLLNLFVMPSLYLRFAAKAR